MAGRVRSDFIQCRFAHGARLTAMKPVIIIAVRGSMTEEEIVTEGHHGRQFLEPFPVGSADAGGGEAVPIVERCGVGTEHLTLMVSGKRWPIQLDQPVRRFSRPQGAGQAIAQVDDLIDMVLRDVATTASSAGRLP
jgi:hypothetical protein